MYFTQSLHFLFQQSSQEVEEEELGPQRAIVVKTPGSSKPSAMRRRMTAEEIQRVKDHMMKARAADVSPKPPPAKPKTGKKNSWITYVFLNYYHLTVTFETPAGSGTVVRSKLFDTPFPIPNTEEESEKEAGSDSEGLEELPESPRPGTSGAQQQLSEMEQAFADSQGRIKKKIYKPSG